MSFEKTKKIFIFSSQNILTKGLILVDFSARQHGGGPKRKRASWLSEEGERRRATWPAARTLYGADKKIFKGMTAEPFAGLPSVPEGMLGETA